MSKLFIGEMLKDDYDRIFVINHRNRVDRLRRMVQRFQEYGLCTDLNDFIKKYRFDAIDGGMVTKTIPCTYTRPLNNGEIGCYLSHLEIWKISVKNGYKRILILEDDAEFTSDFIHKYEFRPDKYEMLYFGRANYDSWNGGGVKDFGVNKDSCKNGVCLSSRNWLTHAYAVDARVLQYLIDGSNKEMFSTIDGVLAELQENLKGVYCFYPSIIKQDGSRSSLR